MGSNQIKASDLFHDDGAIKRAIEDLENLERQYQSTQKTILDNSKRLNDGLKDVNITTQEGTQELERMAQEAEKLRKEQEKLIAAQDSNAKTIAKLKEATKEQNQLTKLQIQLDKQAEGSKKALQIQLKINTIQMEKLRAEGKGVSDEMDALTASTEETETALAELSAEQRKNNEITKNQIKLANAAEGSYNALSAQYSLNTIELNAMSQEQRENTEEGRKLVEETKAIRDRMKELKDEVGDNSLNVGNYTDSIIEAVKRQRDLDAEIKKAEAAFLALPQATQDSTAAMEEHRQEIALLQAEFNNLSEQTGITTADFEEVEESSGGLLDSLSDVPGAAGDAAGGLQGLGGQMKALLANPIVLLIAATAAALYALFDAFSRSEKGAQLFAKTGALLEGFMSVLTGLSVELYDVLVPLFEDPQQAIKDFGEFILNNLINRFLALKDIAFGLGRIIGNLLAGDFEALEEAAKDTGQAVIQFQTGLDVEQQEAFAKKLSEVTDEVLEQADAFTLLAEAQREVAQQNRVLQVQAGELANEEERLNAVLGDSTLSFQEINDISIQAQKSAAERIGTELKIAQNNLSLIQQEIALREANGEQVRDLKDEEVAAINEVQGLKTQQIVNEIEQKNFRLMNEQDRIERDLDINLDGFDNIKAINERRLQDEQLTADQKQSILDSTLEGNERTFAAQIGLVQQLTDEQVNGNDLVNTSNEALLNEKIRSLGLSEVIEGRLLEIIRDKRTADQDLTEAAKDLLQERLDLGVEELERNQEFAQSEFDLKSTTASKVAAFQVQQEIERLEETLKLRQEFDPLLTQIEIDTINNQVEALKGELKDIKAGAPLIERLGLNLNEDQISAIKETWGEAKNIVTEYVDERVRLSEMAVEASDREVDQAQDNLSNQIALAEQGFASNVELAQKELEAAKVTQDKALEEQRRAQRQQAAIQTLEQTGNLITATAKIWGTFGNPLLAIPAIAVMWGSFIASKVKATQLAEEQFGDGTYETLEGGSHASGNDISLGVHKGRHMKAEGGEGMAIFSRKAVSKYGHSAINDLVKSLNDGVYADAQGGSSGTIINTNLDLQDMPTNMRKVANRKSTFLDGKGRRVERYKNVTTTYR